MPVDFETAVDAVERKSTIDEIIKRAKADGTYKDPYEGINFVEFHPIIKDRDGKIIFDEEVTFPDYFRENDIKIVASKYLCNNAKLKETDIRQMINRVSDTITDWGLKDGYFLNEMEALEFNFKLKNYQIHQLIAFNSPVYFNIGLNSTPQLSACFILDVEDNMESISRWGSIEATIFKFGSGSGVNLSKIRSSFEQVKQGGLASGPVSFLKPNDCQAGVIKSGGTFRRSAKMAVLNIGHPDAPEKFMLCKDKEEKKLRILKAAGIEAEPGYELSDEVYFQNTNFSIRFPDEFMFAVQKGEKWHTRKVLNNEIVNTYDAKDLLMSIAEHAWTTGDPGVMFHDNTNIWNTTISDGEFEATNPCGEFCGHSYESCNLTASNLVKFFNGYSFNSDLYCDVVGVLTMAQDIIVDNASYPVEEIRRNTTKYRSLGQGFTNLGGLCMCLGFPYDSDNGRLVASLIASIMTATAYLTSMKIADQVGPGEWWTSNPDNQVSMLNVLKRHRDHAIALPHPIASNSEQDADGLLSSMYSLSKELWDRVIYSFRPIRNSQVTLSAPNGTTSFLVGADTSGPEPGFSLVSFKTLSGNNGAQMMIVNDCVKTALKNLGYNDVHIEHIIDDLVVNDIAIENSVFIKPEHVAIFDTSLPHKNGTRAIDYMGHVNMLCAIQPFISGAISKTINMAKDCTVQDIFDVYFYSWKKGLKSLTVYRDGSKTEQVLTTYDKSKEKESIVPAVVERRKMPTDRDAKIHKFTINGNVEGYITKGHYEDGSLGEIFITMSKDGSTVRGFADALATITSIALQSNSSLETIISKMIYRKFEPAGFCQGNPDIKTCTSIIDYVFKHLAFNYLSDEQLANVGLRRQNADTSSVNMESRVSMSSLPCPVCGELMRRLGSCFTCSSCGHSDGTCG